MTNEQTKDYLLQWCNNPPVETFGWPTDGCGYEQHMKFSNYRNDYWVGGSREDFINFVRKYALNNLNS